MIKKHHLALAAISLETLGAGISGLALVAAAINISEVSGATVVVASSLAGVALGGALVGAAASRLSPHIALLIGEAMRACCVLCLFTMDAGLPLLGVLAAGIALASAFTIANRWDILFKSPEYSETNIYHIQQVEVIAGILSPLAAGYMTGSFGTRYAYLSSFTFLIAGFLAWIIFCWRMSSFAKPTSNHWSGYACIINSKPLSFLIILRILTGSSLVIWSIYLPSALHAVYGDGFASVQGELAALSAIAVACSGFLFKSDKAKKGLIQRFVLLASGSMLMYGLSMAIFASDSQSIYLLCLAAIAFGFYVTSIRTSIVHIGKVITPPESISAVIAAGDSMVRVVNFLVSICFGLLLSVLKSGMSLAALFVSMTLISAIAVLALHYLIPRSDGLNRTTTLD